MVARKENKLVFVSLYAFAREEYNTLIFALFVALSFDAWHRPVSKLQIRHLNSVTMKAVGPAQC
jgi:hypothetical protein